VTRKVVGVFVPRFRAPFLVELQEVPFLHQICRNIEENVEEFGNTSLAMSLARGSGR
jgi:hypothetical protein